MLLAQTCRRRSATLQKRARKVVSTCHIMYMHMKGASACSSPSSLGQDSPRRLARAAVGPGVAQHDPKARPPPQPPVVLALTLRLALAALLALVSSVSAASWT